MRNRLLRFMSMVIVLTMLAVPACAEDALSWLLDLLTPTYVSGGMTAMTGEQTAAYLRELGFSVTDEAVAQVQAEHEKLNQRFGFSNEVSDSDLATGILLKLGWGEFDQAYESWTPTSSEVYAFDTEVADIDGMYGLFLRGVSAIVPGFAPAEVKETLAECAPADFAALPFMPKSEGTKTVSFTLDGHAYQKELDYYGDWFNADAIAWINEVLAAEQYEGRLWPFFDGMQSVILIYGSEERAQKLGQLVMPLPEGQE